MSVAGLGSILSGSGCTQSAQQVAAAKFAQVPRRTLGRTGQKIPCVGLGTVFDMTNKQHVLDGSLEYGMDYWDTATNYGDTKSQLGIGQYLAKHPDVRKRLFLISKPIDLETPLPVIADFDNDIRLYLPDEFSIDPQVQRVLLRLHTKVRSRSSDFSLHNIIDFSKVHIQIFFHVLHNTP